jgi:sterol desaturase/sphingolipid hydroxylase (fatty acid hydroxylase superfamily)
MISLKSFKNFITTNILLIIIGCLEYISLIWSDGLDPIVRFMMTFLILLTRNFSFIYLIGIAIKNRKYVSDHRKEPEESYRGEFAKNVITTTFVDSITMMGAMMILPVFHNTRSYMWDLMMFIPLSFTFDLIFDFFHYWTHRTAHKNKYLYGFLHKKHHKFHDVTPIITFYQDPFDVFITNTIPVLLTLLIVPWISFFQYSLITIYKVSVEIYGHSGKFTSPEFVQCIWLPRFLNIVLTSENHSHHHMFNNCNYSKRFSIWDKIFGTFKHGTVDPDNNTICSDPNKSIDSADKFTLYTD